MPIPHHSDALEKAYTGLSENFRGIDVDIYELCKEKRANEPVMEGDFMASLNVATHAKTGHGLPTYALFKYEDIKKMLADAKTFTSGFIREGLGSFFGGDGLIILAQDGEVHKKTRSLLQPVFMPSNVNKWRDDIDERIRKEFLEHLVPDKKANLMDFGLYFPVNVIYQLIGFPEDHSDHFYEYAAMGLAIIAGPKADLGSVEESRARANAASEGLLELLTDLVRHRREGGADGDDIISQLIRAEEEGERLNDKQIATFVRSLVAAGGETTARTFSSIMTLLLERPDVLERVRNDRSLIPNVINETTRFEPVATVKVRQASEDVEIRGVKIPKGALVQGLVASANRDEEVYDNPDMFDIDRKGPMNFNFGFGPHMCIGQFIAKLELEIALNAMFDMMPNLRIDPDKLRPEIRGGQLRGAGAVYALWD